MQIIVFIWNNLLFKPLFNILIFIYNNYTYFNLGVAVIYLTIFLRILLLPLSIISEKNVAFYKKLSEKIKEVDKDFPNDPIKKREIIRKVMRVNRIYPWAKVLVLAIQLLVLILLYQVFIGGIRENYDYLYPFIGKPDFINTQFLWFDISTSNTYASLTVAIVHFFEITANQRKKKDLLSKRDIYYRIIFPVFTFFILQILPSVKCVFVLTSVVFSFIIISASNLIYFFIGKKREENY